MAEDFNQGDHSMSAAKASKPRVAKEGARVYLTVYPSRTRHYGGEWDTLMREAVRTGAEWGALEEDVLIVEARVVAVRKTIKGTAQ